MRIEPLHFPRGRCPLASPAGAHALHCTFHWVYQCHVRFYRPYWTFRVACLGIGRVTHIDRRTVDTRRLGPTTDSQIFCTATSGVWDDAPRFGDRPVDVTTDDVLLWRAKEVRFNNTGNGLSGIQYRVAVYWARTFTGRCGQINETLSPVRGTLINCRSVRSTRSGKNANLLS